MSDTQRDVGVSAAYEDRGNEVYMKINLIVHVRLRRQWTLGKKIWTTSAMRYSLELWTNFIVDARTLQAREREYSRVQ